MSKVSTVALSSLAKVFPDEELQDQPYSQGSAFQNETYSFQVAYRGTEADLADFKVEVESELEPFITVRKVGLVQADTPVYPHSDKYVLRRDPGLYPDPLYPLYIENTDPVYREWNALWVSVELTEEAAPGKHEINIQILSSTDELLGTETFTLEVLPYSLPEQTLIQTNWFHTDCLATEYEVDMFSEAHWVLIDKYVATATKNGMNMLLTPLFTIPLDTEVGGERPTHQLVGVEKTNETYTFNFDLLVRWVEMAQKNGIKYLEFSHFFTQWGAYHAPKIIATVDGEEQQIFGWETDAAGTAYKDFLDQFLPALKDFLVAHEIEDMAYFHISDEPSLDQIESYKNASEIVQAHLGDYPIIDALSDYQFYEKGLVKNPIPANDHLEPFLENEVPDLWTYYCCAQTQLVSNRFFSFPSARNRISGFQFYKYDIVGFLHWGYNFWYSQFSIEPIDPYTVTDAGGGFASGDAFLVYPGKEGPIESLKYAVFYEALQDQRALQMLESLTSKEHALRTLETELFKPITFKEYPRESNWLLAARERINAEIVKQSEANK